MCLYSKYVNNQELKFQQIKFFHSQVVGFHKLKNVKGPVFVPQRVIEVSKTVHDSFQYLLLIHTPIQLFFHKQRQAMIVPSDINDK